MTHRLNVPVLAGSSVRLEPLAVTHVDGLTAAAAEARATYGWTTVPRERDAMAGYVGALLRARDSGETIPFAQVSVARAHAVGVTRFLTMRIREGERVPYAVEIGGTWLAASAQRTGINTEAKLLLLAHAFEVWKAGRVDFKTDARNTRSREAILRIGARFEAVLRGWQPSHVTGEEQQLRDSAMYSIVAAEWPEVRRKLEQRLGRE